MTTWNEIQALWEDNTKKISSNWNKLSEVQIGTINGNRVALSEAIQHTYRCNATEADQQIDAWLNNLLGTKPTPGQLVENLDEKLAQNQDSAETIEERDTIVGSPYHKGY